jgi:sulfate transport system permease protein
MAKKKLIPGFGISMGCTVTYMSLLVLVPLAMLGISSVKLGWEGFAKTISSPRVLSSFWLSFYTALISASVNTVIGLIVAWVLVRYGFPGRKFLDSLVDLPFALPTSVAGISLTALFSANGWIGHWLEKLGIHVVNTPLGIIIALIFIGFPFVVRTVQPVLLDMEPEIEEAAASLGANRLAIFIRVILPALAPALFTGFTLVFARSLGEYGSVIFISGNLPFTTEIAPLLIMSKLDQFDYTGASSIAVALLVISLGTLVVLNLLGRRQNGSFYNTKGAK